MAIWILPEELTLEWDKQPLGEQVGTNVASLLESGNIWQCKFNFYSDTITNHKLGNMPELSVGAATLSIMCSARDVLVSYISQFNLYVVKA